jgi:hypothetical protein
VTQVAAAAGFISDHNWADTNQSQKVATISHGDNSWTDIPGVFFYTDGMPILTNKNQYPGLKLMNETEFEAEGIIPGDQPNLKTNTIIHFGAPAAILLSSQETQNIKIPGLLGGQILLAADKITLTPTQNRFKFLTRKYIQRSLACTLAFALIDYKAQGRTFKKIIVNLRAQRAASNQINPIVKRKRLCGLHVGGYPRLHVGSYPRLGTGSCLSAYRACTPADKFSGRELIF